MCVDAARRVPNFGELPGGIRQVDENIDAFRIQRGDGVVDVVGAVIAWGA
jgi:hypothetical protein